MEQGQQPGPDEVVVEQARSGDFADFTDRTKPKNNLPEFGGDKGGPERTVSAKVIRRLATEPQNPPVHPKGIRIRGARIQGQLDFEGALLLVPLILEKCHIGDRIILTNASAPAMDLRGSYAADGIGADGLEVRHDLFLGGGFHSKGEVRLIGTTVGRQLACRGGNFDGSETPQGGALTAERIKAGDLFIGGGEVKGAMNFFGANVGVLNVDGGFAGKEAKRDATCGLVLQHVRALSVKDEGADWSGCGLVLDGFVYEHICRFPDGNVKKRLEWLRRQDSEHFFPQPYDQVVRVLRRMGYGEDARQIGIKKYKDWGKHLTLPRRIWPFFLHCFVGHGYRPHWAVVWMVLVAIVGWVVFSAGNRAHLMQPALKEKVCTSRQVRFSPWLYSLDLLVPTGVMDVNFHEKSCFVPTYPDSNPGSKKSVAESTWVLWRLCELWYFLEIFLGPILIIFLAAALGGLIERETT